MPNGQSTQKSRFKDGIFPDGQKSQKVLDMFEYFPKEQLEHSVAPRKLVYFPAVQFVQTVSPTLENVPLGHEVQIPLTGEGYCPA